MVIEEETDFDAAMLNISEEEFLDILFQHETENYQLSEPMLVMCALYGMLFIFGILGNFWVITVVGYIFKKLGNVIQNHNIFLYILALSVVDFLQLCTLPMLISNIYSLRWIFGEYLCKVYWIVESSNKMYSTFILVALSCDRYFAICRPNCVNRLHCIRSTAIIISVLLILVAVLLTPIYISAGQHYTHYPVYFENQTFHVEVVKCHLYMTENLVFWFTIYMFGVSFCIPSSLIIYFYASILYKLYEHKIDFSNSANIHSRVPLSKVTRSAFMLIIFYFICWTPYWCITLYLALKPHSTPDLNTVHVMYALHAMVHVHSAFDWILYAFMNQNLRECKVLAFKRKSRCTNFNDGAKEELVSMIKRNTLTNTTISIE